MNILVFPKVEGEEKKIAEIIDNFKNGLIPEPIMSLDGQRVGRVKEYTEMEDGLYFDIELEGVEEFKVMNKKYTPKLIDFADDRGNYYHNVLSEIIVGDIELNKLGGQMDYIQPKLQEGIPQKPTKSKLELLADFKKQLEKNGFIISDQKLEELLQVIQMGGVPQLRKLNQEIKLSGNPNQVIKVFPRKKCYFEKYEESIDFNEKFFDDVINNFNNPKLFKPYIDEDHNLEEKYAEIIQLEKREDGLYAHIELNTIGLDAIKNNKYSYISPEWGDRVDTEKKLHKNVLWAVTLTNIPAFEGELPRLQDQMKLKKNKGAKKMSKRLISLAADMKKLDFNTELQDGGDNTAVIEEALAMIQELAAKLQEALGAKDQAEEQMEETQAQLATIKKDNEEKEMNDFFEDAVKKSKIEPHEVDTLKELYKLDKCKVRTLIEGKKEIENKQKTLSAKSNGDGLEALDYEIMEKQGYMNDDGTYQIAAYKKAIGG